MVIQHCVGTLFSQQHSPHIKLEETVQFSAYDKTNSFKCIVKSGPQENYSDSLKLVKNLSTYVVLWSCQQIKLLLEIVNANMPEEDQNNDENYYKRINLLPKRNVRIETFLFKSKNKHKNNVNEEENLNRLISYKTNYCNNQVERPFLLQSTQRKCHTFWHQCETKQFLQLFICFLVIVRVILWPEYCDAIQQQKQQQQHKQYHIEQNEQIMLVTNHPITTITSSPPPPTTTTIKTTSNLSKNIPNLVASIRTASTIETVKLPSESALDVTTIAITKESKRTIDNHNNSLFKQHIHTHIYDTITLKSNATILLNNKTLQSNVTKLVPALITRITSSIPSTPLTSQFPKQSRMSDNASSVKNDFTILITTTPTTTTTFQISKENFDIDLDFMPSNIKRHYYNIFDFDIDFDQYNNKNITAYRLKRSLQKRNSNGNNIIAVSNSSNSSDNSNINVINAQSTKDINNVHVYAKQLSTITNDMKMSNDSANNRYNVKSPECPSFNENSACPCYNFEDGLFLECPGITTLSLRSTLEQIMSPVHSLSIYDYDRSITSLSHDIFPSGVQIKHLQFSHSHLEILKENSLKNLRTSLESLSIVNSKLTQLPSRALHSMQKLNAVDFDYNDISLIENYSFYGLRLIKLNIKGNHLQNIPEYSFVGLEESIQEIDLSENNLSTFPLLALKKLDHLRILRLSNNKINTFYGEIALTKQNATSLRNFHLPSLIFLDLSSNQFTEIMDKSFQAFPQLKTLSLYANQIELIQPEAFKNLRELLSLDMSHNRIIILDAKLLQMSQRLQTIDLSHNHIHRINGVFSNLPQLREIFLSENNILDLPADAFTNSTQIEVIYLEMNAIAHVDPNVFSTLINLNHLYLRANFIPLLPITLLDKCQKLNSISLDSNEIRDLEIGMFRKLVFLREIRLHNNRIRRIRKGVFEPLLALQELHLQKNNIEDIEPAAFKTLINLQHINLQENQLTVLEDIFPREHNNASLLTIQLGGNYLRSIHPKTFTKQNKIQIMWLNDNQLIRINKSLFVDANNLARLYLDNNLIKDIEHDTFVNVKQLKFLNMSNNQLKEIRRDFFSFLENLEDLYLSNNVITAIEGFAFSELRNLHILDLSHNPILQIAGDIFLEELSLTHLYLRNTSLHKIEVNALTSLINLNVLDLSGNLLNSIDIQRLGTTNLRSLSISNVNFSQATMASVMPNMFDNLRSLQHLTMDNCSLNVLPEKLFFKNTNLVKLNLCNNFIKALNSKVFQGLDVFKELKLCHNHLNEFPHMVLYNLSTLEILDLSQNHFTSIDFYKLSGTINLRHLNLRDNKITTLTGFHAVNLTQLDTFDISGNLLLSLPANFLRHSINLQRVDLSRNRLFQIPSSVLSDASIPRLSWLNLTGNPINKIYTVKEERYIYLKELYICQTNLSILTSKDFEAFQALQHLNLVNNRITRISPGAFKGLTNLLTLDISINELEILPKERLQGLKLLRLLNISHNTLKDLEEFSADLNQLQTCDLSFNQLDRISRKTFRNLHSLTDLYLMGNRMTVLSTEAFRYLKKLKILDLRRNYFELIPIEALQPLETNIKILRLEENPLHCSCDAQKLWEWLRDHRKWSSSLSIEGLTSSTASILSIPSPLYAIALTSSSSSSSSLSSSTSLASSFVTSSLSTTTMTSSNDGIHYLRCEHPAELRGKIFSKMEPQQFCDAPLIPKIAIQDIQPYSVIVSWQSREHLGLNGYEIVYHIISDANTNSVNGNVGALSGNNINSGSTVIDDIRGKRLNGSANSAKLTRLVANARYHICVIGTGNWLSESVNNTLRRIHFNDTFLLDQQQEIVEHSALSSLNLLQPIHQDIYATQSSLPRHQSKLVQSTQEQQQQQQQAFIKNTINTEENALEEILKNSRFSTCTDVQTLDSIPSLMTDDNGLANNSFIHSILTRRLGLIVGCCLGIIVFIIMVSVLSYVKLKKQRIENAKRQAVMPPDYMSYRHFSIPNEELLRSNTVMSSVPSGISAHISGTSLSMSTSTNTVTATTPLKISESLDKSFATTCGGVTAATIADVKTRSISGGCENLITSTEMATLNDSINKTELIHNQQQHVHQCNQQQQQHHQHQQQQYIRQKNGNAVGYINASTLLGANHANSNVAC